MLQWPKYNSSATISPDWDILKVIIRWIELFPHPPNINFIPSHQDKKKKYEELSNPAQANVDADTQAGEYRYIDLSSTYAPVILGSTIALHSSAGMITSHHKQKLRKLLQFPIIRDYISQKAGWSIKFELIDWKSHKTRLVKQYEDKNCLCKYVHDWIPVGTLLSRYAPHYSTKCPSCTCSIEERWHLLQCSARTELRKTFIATL